MSTLFSQASQVAKRIVKSPERRAVHDALQSITSFSDDQIRSGRANSLEYYARKQQQQFSALLLLNSSLPAVKQQLPPLVQLSPLSDEQHKQFSIGDRFIRAINGLLLDQLRPILGNWTVACDPYPSAKGIEYHPETSKPDALLAEAAAEIDALVRLWGSHPLLPELGKLVETVPSSDDDTILSTILIAKRVLEDTPGRPTVVDVKSLRDGRSGRSTTEDSVSRLFGRLFVLRKALTLIDALLYDAFKVSRLLPLTADSVFDIRQTDSDQLGPVVSVDLQAFEEVVSRNRGDMVFLTQLDDHAPHGPALIVSQIVSMSRATGATVTFDLRMLDSWMNPYPYLWRP